MRFNKPLWLSMVHTGGDSLDNRNRNLAIVLGASLLYLILGITIGFFTVSACIVFVFAIIKLRMNENRLGYSLIGIGLIMLIHEHLLLVLMFVIFLFVFFYVNSKQMLPKPDHIQKQAVLHSLKREHEQYELSHMSVWSVINEVTLDLSYALLEKNEITITLHGLIGDIDIIVPKDMAIKVDAELWIGEIEIDGNKESGTMCRVIWCSPDYEHHDMKVNLVCSFIVGDIQVKIL